MARSLAFRIDAVMPRVIPTVWRRVKNPVLDQMGIPNRAYVSTLGLQALISIDDFRPDPAGVWLHLSVSRPNMLPSWDELKRAKAVFMGDRLAIQILPPRAAYLNVHNFCLHLFARLDGDTIPEPVWNQLTGPTTEDDHG